MDIREIHFQSMNIETYMTYSTDTLTDKPHDIYSLSITHYTCTHATYTSHPNTPSEGLDGDLEGLACSKSIRSIHLFFWVKKYEANSALCVRGLALLARV